jgi:hypothetical protein
MYRWRASMKERSLLYFISAVVASMLLILSIFANFYNWFDIDYVSLAAPELHKMIIPVALLWLGWFFSHDGLSLASLIIFTVLFGFFLDNFGVLYSPASDHFIYVFVNNGALVKTMLVLSVMLFTGLLGFGYYGYFLRTKDQNKFE